jgi:hypothetical protein
MFLHLSHPERAQPWAFTAIGKEKNIIIEKKN